MDRFRRLLGLAVVPTRAKQDPAMNVHCGEFEVNNWLVSEFVLNTLVPIVGVHPFPLNELVLMVAAVCRLKPGRICEWGTHLGKSARVFYETARHFGLDVEIHSVDLPDHVLHQEHPGHQRGMLVKGLQDVHLHQGDGLSVCLDIQAQAATPKQTLIFIDGDHSYASVRRELAGIMNGIPEAHILLHDTFFQSSESGYNVGPYRAIAEAITETDVRYRLLSTQTGLPGMTLLYQLPQTSMTLAGK
jgi:Methyltransferase domain